MTDFVQRASKEIQRRKLLSRGRKILVAVSGGVDSMVLLHVLHSLAPQNRWEISVAHFNHQLREAAGADEKFVKRAAAKLGLVFFGERADVGQFAAQSKLSVEMAARKLRHEFLAATARKHKISVIALAHHADDQVELFFLRLLRGTGGDGLSGMKWRSASPAGRDVTLIRPFLAFTKSELLDHARENKIRFRDDSSNFSTEFLRNRIRNELLPLLQKSYQPGLNKTILRLMEIVGAEAGFAGDAARLWLARPATAFETLPVAVQRKILQSQLVAAGVVADFELIEQLRFEPGKFVSTGPGLSVARDASTRISLRRQSSSGFNSDARTVQLRGRAGRLKFGDRNFSWRQKTLKPASQKPGIPIRGAPSGIRFAPLSDGPDRSRTEFFDAAKVGDEVILRHWRAGDRFQPIGLKSAVKLQDLFVNAKIPADRRRELVVATTAGGGIFWVEGLRIGEPYKLTGETARILVWNVPK